MTKHEMDNYRPNLLNLKQRLRGEIDTLADEAFHKNDGKAVGNLSNIPVDDRASLASDISCEETTLGLFEDTSASFAEVNAALDRIDEGAFGCCEDCGQDLSNDRLKNVPFARQCIQCARKAQKRRPASPGNLQHF